MLGVDVSLVTFLFFHIIQFYLLLFITSLFSFILLQYYFAPRNIFTISDYKIHIYKMYQPVPWPNQLIIGPSPWRPGFNPSPVHVQFVENKVTLGQDICSCNFIFFCQDYSTNFPYSFIKHQYCMYTINN